MNAVQIVEAHSKAYPNLGRYFFAELAAGKHAIVVSVSKLEVRVMVTSNASHKCWKGMGKGFKDFAEAIAYYKTPAIQSMLQAAAAANVEDAMTVKQEVSA